MIQLYPDEKIVMEVRRHWYILVAETLFLLFFVVAPFFAFGFLNVFDQFLAADKVVPLFLFMTSAWFLIVWITFFIIWTNYYLDVWIITDKRIIDVEQYYLFSREVSEFKLEKIQDITVEIHGLLPTLLHFGDVHVQTAGQMREFVIRYVPYPDQVKDTIFKLHDIALKNGEQQL